jgi:hypothetical protein
MTNGGLSRRKTTNNLEYQILVERRGFKVISEVIAGIQKFVFMVSLHISISFSIRNKL